MSSKIDRRKFLLASGGTAALAAFSPRRLLGKTRRFEVTGLKVDYVDCPLGLENVHPQFSWRLESTARNVRQGAYRIQVASSEKSLRSGLGDLWDSGKVDSRQSFGIRYGGSSLASRQQCWWRVQVWDGSGRRFALSSFSKWEMGLLSAADWHAKWLEVDDPVAKQDREAQAQWIWGSSSSDRSLRQLRVKFSLPTASYGGDFFAKPRGMGMYLSGMWIDDHPVRLVRYSEEALGEHVLLDPLEPGEHCLTIEIGSRNADEVLPVRDMYASAPQYGVAILARFDLRDGHKYRVPSGSAWQTRSSVDPEKQKFGAWGDVQAAAFGDNKLIVDPVLYLRRKFETNKSVVTARLYVTALGAYEARINGHRVADALLSPEVSQYRKRALYRVYDVKELLREGSNAIGLIVGDGWYGSHPGRYSWGPPPRLALAQLELVFQDRSTEVVVTDGDWRISRSPILRSELTLGEFYDARAELPGWDAPGFDDTLWSNTTIAEPPRCRVVGHISPPIRATQTLRARVISNPSPGVYVFDFGQNFAGWCRLRVKGAAGTRIDMRFAEQLKPSGEIDQFGLFGLRAKDTYVLRGDPVGESFEPHFVYHGFRYAELTGLAESPSADTLEGVFIHSDLELTSSFEIDSPLIEKYWRSILWTHLSNLTGVLTDCPNRAERMGYFGEVNHSWDSLSLNTDLAAFARRYMDEVRDAQRANGSFPDKAPNPGPDLLPDGSSAGFSEAIVIGTWICWQRYGDLDMIEKNWQAMNRFAQFLEDNNPSYLWINKRGPDFGDWNAVLGGSLIYPSTGAPATPNDLIATAYWGRVAAFLAQMARATNRTADAERFDVVFQKISTAFCGAFVKPNGEIGSGTQTCYILAIEFGLLPEDLRKPAAELLAADIRKRGTSLTTGMLGTRYILDVLANAGCVDLLYGLLLRAEYPSWGFMVRNGATTIWERWDGNLRHCYNENSHNHHELGTVGGSLLRHLAGIDAASPAFENIVVRPLLDSRVKECGGRYDSMMGRIATKWSQEYDGRFVLAVTIPANTSARIHLPAKRGNRILEGEQEIASDGDILSVKRFDDEALVEVGSGSYRFTVIAPS